MSNDRVDVWRQICARLQACLEDAGLRESADYAFHGEDVPHHYTVVELRSIDLLTAGLLLCSAKVLLDQKPHWGAIFSVCDPDRVLVPLVEVSGGGFSTIDDSDTIGDVVAEAYRISDIEL